MPERIRPVPKIRPQRRDISAFFMRLFLVNEADSKDGQSKKDHYSHDGALAPHGQPTKPMPAGAATANKSPQSNQKAATKPMCIAKGIGAQRIGQGVKEGGHQARNN